MAEEDKVSYEKFGFVDTVTIGKPLSLDMENQILMKANITLVNEIDRLKGIVTNLQNLNDVISAARDKAVEKLKKL